MLYGVCSSIKACAVCSEKRDMFHTVYVRNFPTIVQVSFIRTTSMCKTKQQEIICGTLDKEESIYKASDITKLRKVTLQYISS